MSFFRKEPKFTHSVQRPSGPDEAQENQRLSAEVSRARLAGEIEGDEARRRIEQIGAGAPIFGYLKSITDPRIYDENGNLIGELEFGDRVVAL